MSRVPGCAVSSWGGSVTIPPFINDYLDPSMSSKRNVIKLVVV